MYVSIRLVFTIIVWLKRHVKRLVMILKICQICRLGHAKCVCGNAPPSTLTASASTSSTSSSSSGCLFYFFVFFSFLLLFLSNTAENVVILRSLRFVSFLIYSMAASM